jgi:hypothetical protein
MRHLLILLVHLSSTVLQLVRPGGVHAVVAKSVLAKHQLLILNRSRRRAPNLRVQAGKTGESPSSAAENNEHTDASDFFDPTPEQQNIILVSAVTLHMAQSCEQCNPEGAKIH